MTDTTAADTADEITGAYDIDDTAPQLDGDADEPGTEISLPGEQSDGALDLFPPAQRPMMEARVMLREHVGMMRDAFHLADAVCYTDAVPLRYRGKPKDGAAAIMYGAELGLNPMTSLQKVINVHGTPSLEARSMKGLLKSKGFQFRVTERTATRFRIEAWEPGSSKRNDPPDEVSEWTIERAQLAEFCPVIDPATGEYRTFNKKSGGTAVVGNMKYITQPTEMLEAKGTAEVCRAIAPEVLMGMPYSAEEVETERWVDDDDRDDRPAAAPTEQRRARGTDGLRERARKRRTKAEPKPEPVDAEVVDDPAPTPDVVPEPVPDATPDPEPQPAPDITPEPAPVAEPTPTPEPEPAPAGSTMVDLPEQPGDPAPADEAQAAAGPDEPAKTQDTPATPQATAGPDRPADDMEMSASVRSKGDDMLVGLLINGGIATDEYRPDALSEVLAKRPEQAYRRINNVSDLTNGELKWLVDTLRGWKAKGQLEAWLGEAVNNAALRAAGLLEDGA